MKFKFLMIGLVQTLYLLIQERILSINACKCVLNSGNYQCKGSNTPTDINCNPTYNTYTDPCTLDCECTLSCNATTLESTNTPAATTVESTNTPAAATTHSSGCVCYNYVESSICTAFLQENSSNVISVFDFSCSDLSIYSHKNKSFLFNPV